MQREKSWEKISQIGKGISERWKLLAEKYELNIDTWGLSSLSGYTFKSKHNLIYKTLITQEMLKKGYLAANSVYVCIDHNQKVVDGYFEVLDPIFSIIKDGEDGMKIGDLLEGPICHSGFSRLN